MTTFDFFYNPLFGSVIEDPYTGMPLFAPPRPPHLFFDGEGTLWIDGIQWVRTFAPVTEVFEPIPTDWWTDVSVLTEPVVVPVPEPSGVSLLLVGLLFLARWRKVEP